MWMGTWMTDVKATVKQDKENPNRKEFTFWMQQRVPRDRGTWD